LKGETRESERKFPSPGPSFYIQSSAIVPELFTLFHPAMSVRKLRLVCLIWPNDDPDEHIVVVEVDNNQPVAFVKELIKLKHAPVLDELASYDLVLWKCSGLPDDDNLEESLKTLQFNGVDDRLVHLNARLQISQYLGNKDLSKEPIHILVQLPALGECGTHISYSRLRLDRYLYALFV
jgi:hypothetical protein